METLVESICLLDKIAISDQQREVTPKLMFFDVSVGYNTPAMHLNGHAHIFAETDLQ